MEKRCRLCMKRSDDLQNILDYDSDNKTTIVQNISLFFAVDITLTDHLPKDICQSCIKFVKYVSHRRKEFLENQDKLKDELYSALKRNCFIKPTTKRVEPIEYKLSDLKIPASVRNDDIFPTVEIINLEESDIHKEYKRISEFTYRKIKPTAVVQRRRQPSVVYRQPRVQQNVNRPPLYNIEEVKVESTFPENVLIKEEPPVVPMNTWSDYVDETLPENCNIIDNTPLDVADSIFVCSVCNAVFDSNELLVLHQKNHIEIKMEPIF